MRFFFFLIFLPFVLTALASAPNVTITTTTLPNGTVQMPYSRTVRFSHNWFQFVCQQAERFVLAEHNGPKVRVSRSNAKCGLNPSAARSLEEGMEETLTVHRLRVPAQLRRTLASTNVIESAFSIVETVCRNVKRWRAGDHIERWVGSGLLVAERQFRKVQGYREIPALLTSLANAVSKKGVAEDVKVA